MKPKTKKRKIRPRSSVKAYVICDVAGWKKISAVESKCRKWAAAAASAVLGGSRAELTIVLSNDKLLKRLNCDWRGKNKPTNVLSFPNYDRVIVKALQKKRGVKEPLMLGDVAIALETVKREAKTQHKTIEAHLAHMVIHGTLHLLGHDHMVQKQAKYMETLEKNILRQFGFSNPYEYGKVKK
ncbi:MAG: rRNA maturation RNase YbeY [Alphaproteobacteria bacterium]|nr:MAG: rRNA maturation RNase YbeY [Alphaproteobacteria bacterium]